MRLCRLARLAQARTARRPSGEASNEGIPPLDLLALNRVLDLCVSRASIAYVDDLFFAHLQGSGVPEGITPDLLEETDRQLQGFRKELEL